MSTKPSWSESPWRELGEALLASPDEWMTAGRLGIAAGKDPSQTRHLAEAMFAAGLLERAEARAKSGPGRPAKWEYRLSDDERTALEELSSGALDVGQTTAGAQWVVADSSPAHQDGLMVVLARAELTSAASWFASSEQAVAIAFGGARAASAAAALTNALAAARVPCQRFAIAETGMTDLLTDRARSALQTAQSVRLESNTRRQIG